MKKLLTLLFFSIFLIGIVSAGMQFEEVPSGLTFDNTKSHKIDDTTSRYGKIDIRNGFGLLGRLAEVELLDNSDVCLNDCFAEGTITLYKPSKLFNQIEFRKAGLGAVDMESAKLYLVNEQEVAIQVPNYERVCSFNSKNNSEVCESVVANYTTVYETERTMELYDGKTLQEGTYKWRIEATKDINEAIDWVGSIFGNELTEWAWWNNSMPYAKVLNFTTQDAINNNYTHRVQLPWINNFGSSCEKMALVWKNQTEIDMDIHTCNSTTVELRFRNNVSIGAGVFDNNYSIYYGTAITRKQDNNIVYVWNDDFTGTALNYSKYASVSANNCTIADNTCTTTDTSNIRGNINFGVNTTIEMNLSFQGTGGAPHQRYFGFVPVSGTAIYAGGNPYFVVGGNEQTGLARNGQSVTGFDNNNYHYFAIFRNSTVAGYGWQDNSSAFSNYSLSVAFTDTTALPVGIQAVNSNGQKLGYLRAFSDVSARPLYELGAELENFIVSTQLESPEDNYNSPSNNISFEVNSSAFGDSVLNNVSLYIWNSSLEALNTDPSLVAWYKLDHNALDATGRNNGTINGGVTNGEGIVGGSMELNGVNGYINISTLPSYINRTQTSSFSFWVNKHSSLTQHLLHLTTSSSNRYGARITDSAIYYGSYNGTSWNSVRAVSINTLNEWNHVTLINSNGVYSIYINSILNTVTENSYVTGPENEKVIGKDNGNYEWFNGSIDDVRIYNRSLTAEEVYTLYSQTQPNQTRALPDVPSIVSQFNVTGLPQGTNYWNAWTSGDNGVLGGYAISDYQFLVDIEAPTLDITYPDNILIPYHKLGTNITINFTAQDLNGMGTCIIQYASENRTVDCNENTTQFNVTSVGNRTAILWANDTVGSSTSVSASWNYTLFEVSNQYNSSTVETSAESFITNITTQGVTISSANLYYNGTSYAGTVQTSGNNHVLTRSINVPLINGVIDWFWSVNYNTGVQQNLSTNTQTVGEINFGLCNTTNNIPYLNITFKDESTLANIDASIPLSEFVYYVNSISQNKTLTFVNNTDNPSYAFCFTPANLPVTVEPYVQYKQGTAYPQRIWNPSAVEYTNSTTNQVLYLLGSSDGLYVTFQVVNPSNQVISGVTVTASRNINGEDVIVGTAITGDDGSVTFWLNPDFTHTFTFEKTGFDTFTTSFAPTQSSYTITMGGGSSEQISDYTKGISVRTRPESSADLVNHTTYNFNLTLTSSYWDLDGFGYVLRLPNGTILDSESSSSNGGFLSSDLNTGNYSVISMYYYWTVNGTNSTRLVNWNIRNSNYGGFGIKTFFTDLDSYMDSGLFGIDDFGRYTLIFLIIFISVGVMSFKYGLDSPMAITSILFGVILFFDWGVGLIPNPVNAIPYFPTFAAGLLLIIVIMREVSR